MSSRAMQQPKWRTVCNYLQFFPSEYYTHVICRHCDINGGRYTRHHLPNKTVTPLNSTNSCQQMAPIAISPLRQLPETREILFINGIAWLLWQTMSWAMWALPYRVISNNENTHTNLWLICVLTVFVSTAVAQTRCRYKFNPLNAELNPICYLLALLGAHHFLHVSRIRVKSLTLRLLISYIYIYIYIWH